MRRAGVTWRPSARILGVTVGLAIASMGTVLPIQTTSAAHSRASLRGTAPDIVLILTDDQPTSSIANMPYVSAQRDAGAYVQLTGEVNNALCCPSRATILSGMVDTRTGVTNNSEADNFDPANTIGVALQGTGYRTGFFGKLLNGYTGAMWPGWSDFQPVLPRNIYQQYDYTVMNNGVAELHGSAVGDYLTDVLTAKAVDFIDQTPPGRPLLLYVAPTSPHTPFVAAPRDIGTLSGTSFAESPNVCEADVSDKPQYIRQRPLCALGVTGRRKQAEAALSVDDMVREVEAKLAATGRLGNTVEIFMSDNGLSQGSHRWTTKRCEYVECVGVPFLVRYPGQPGRNDSRLASNVDLASTFTDLAGTTMPTAQDGLSLVPILEDPSGRAVGRDAILEHWSGGDESGVYGNANAIPGFYGVRALRWRYVELTNLAVPGNTEYELYDEVNDPYELVNLAGDPAYATQLARLQTRMYQMISATGATPGAPQGAWRG